MANPKKVREQSDRQLDEELEDELDMLIYEERKNGANIKNVLILMLATFLASKLAYHL